MARGATAFEGSKLKEAREARNLTLTLLEHMLKEEYGFELTKQSLSQYEKNKQKPGLEVIELLSRALDVSTQFFMGEPTQESSRVGSHLRSKSAMPDIVQNGARHKLKWFADLYFYLEQYLDFPDVELLSPNSDDPLALTNRQIESYAGSLRELWKLGKGAIANVSRVLESHGIIIGTIKFGTSEMEGISGWKKNRPFILINSSHKDIPGRKRLTLAHELGHLVLHHSVEPNETTHRVWEKQAYRFGSAFLLPAQEFSGDIQQIIERMRSVSLNRRTSFLLDSLFLLKDKWHVSGAAMIHRCSDLFLLSEYDIKRLWIRYTQLGYRSDDKQEPLDNVIPSEPPEMVRTGIMELLTEDYISAEDIETNLFFSLSDVEEFANLTKGQLRVNHNPKIRFKRKVLDGSNVRVENRNGAVILYP